MDALSFGAIFVTIVFWASAFAGIRAGLEAFDPGHLTLYRFLVASLALGLYALAVRLKPPSPRDLARIFGLSLLGITAYHLALNYGQQTVPAGTASLIVAAGPVITALLGAWFMGERRPALGWLGTLIALAGVALIVLGSGESLEFTRGALLILLAALVTSLYFVFQRGVVARVGSLRFTVYSLILGTLPLLIFLPGFGAELTRAPLKAHLAVVYIGLFPAALAYLTWTYALSRVGASRTTSFLNVSPVFAILIGWLWLGEVPHPVSLIGGGIALLGVILVNTLGRARRAPQPAVVV
ncbi:DMT family transporter [Deinococcus peraridilitoris]|uniref:Putative permease, DMT superfamily n=1 Tax=Deinococcus peraridilitoris (strain DSM 19664 / LMG 22246 / CIP 109416 / KR-200) TaxID=937777 RepID=L0A242_DEIPD|nr:DMT family transporter [Deinococcus peraridilitoris]AFZ67916.1 putative permease, DMT superfamily [Deinococcus peraridilitoris DSM 19664]